MVVFESRKYPVVVAGSSVILFVVQQEPRGDLLLRRVHPSSPNFERRTGKVCDIRPSWWAVVHDNRSFSILFVENTSDVGKRGCRSRSSFLRGVRGRYIVLMSLLVASQNTHSDHPVAGLHLTNRFSSRVWITGGDPWAFCTSLWSQADLVRSW